MFLSESLQRQYGRRQVTGHMTEPTYRRAIQYAMLLSVSLRRQYGSRQITGHITEPRFRYMSCDLSPTILTLK
jgi:hypothetical protein